MGTTPPKSLGLEHDLGARRIHCWSYKGRSRGMVHRIRSRSQWVVPNSSHGTRTRCGYVLGVGGNRVDGSTSTTRPVYPRISLALHHCSRPGCNGLFMVHEPVCALRRPSRLLSCAHAENRCQRKTAGTAMVVRAYCALRDLLFSLLRDLSWSPLLPGCQRDCSWAVWSIAPVSCAGRHGALQH